MTDIRFYHLTRSPIEKALPQILLKALQTGKAILVYGDVQEDRIQSLNDQLWTFDDKSFIPHGTEKEGNPKDQPVWLTNKASNDNDAKILILFDNTQIQDDTSLDLKSFDLVCYFFDGAQSDVLNASRGYWKKLSDQDGLELTYWQQDQKGRWSQKA